MLLSERGRAVHQYEQLDDTADFVEIADGSLQRGQQVDRDRSRGLLSFRGGQIRTEFAGPGLAVFFGNVPGNEDEIAGADERNEGRGRRVKLRKSDIPCFEAVIYGHCDLLDASSGTADNRNCWIGAESHRGRVGAAEEDADAFTGLGLIAAGEQGGECGCTAGFGDCTEHAPQSLSRLDDLVIADEDDFCYILLCNGE